VLRILNIVLGVVVFGTAVWLYHVKYDVRASVRRVHELEREIAETKHDIALLEAEWTYLNRPERLQEIAVNHLDLTTITTGQIIVEEDIGRTIRMRPEPEPAEMPDDPIADLLGGMR
jgi:cell division protein FtsL